MNGGRVLKRIEPRAVIAIVAMLLAAGEADGIGGPCDLNEQTKLTAADAAAGDQFGIAVAVSGTRVWFVDDDGDPANACCTSWADPCPELQTALSLARPGDQIWVAAGLYAPAGPDGDRAATFHLISGVAVYGGFAGNETTLDERAGLFDETILSGDLNGDDASVADPTDLFFEPTRAENSFHVVTGSGTDATAVLDGFTILAGNANGFLFPNDIGGGMLNDGGNPRVSNCTFRANAASTGGGMFNWRNSEPTVRDCTFSGNAAPFSGGGMFNADGSSPMVSNCTFSGNSAGRVAPMSGSGSGPTGSNSAFAQSTGFSGGGMHNIANSNPTVINCTFNGNTARFRGGGMFNNCSSPALTNCTFGGNAATSGGGVANLDGSPTVTNCTFGGNSADRGGGVFNQSSNAMVTNCTFSGNTGRFGGGIGIVNSFGGSSTTVTNCTFVGNSAILWGGGMSVRLHGDLAVTNCTFVSNSAEWGGGMHNSSSEPTVTDCTFSANAADAEGGGMFNLFADARVTNCILWGNVDDADGNAGGPFMDESAQIDELVGGVPGLVITHSCIQGCATFCADADARNIDADPLFVDPLGPDGVAGTEDDDLRLRCGSPCVDAGSNAAVPPDTADLDGDGDTDEPIPFDLGGRPRFVDDPATPDCPQSPGACGEPPIVDMGAYEFACDEPPTVTCSAIVPDGDDHDDGDLIIAFSAEAACGSVAVSAVIALACEDGSLEVPVDSGAVIELECDDEAHECEVEAEDGVLEIESGSAVLIVTAVDACGNTTTCTLDLCAAADDSEEDDGSPEG